MFALMTACRSDSWHQCKAALLTVQVYLTPHPTHLGNTDHQALLGCLCNLSVLPWAKQVEPDRPTKVTCTNTARKVLRRTGTSSLHFLRFPQCLQWGH
eukprot:2785004-Amphidinium_carterae.1